MHFCVGVLACLLLILPGYIQHPHICAPTHLHVLHVICSYKTYMPIHTLFHRSQHRLYKRKDQLRLSEMWVTDCMGEVMEATLPPNTAFVLGWPITNCVAAFSSPEEKSLWYTLLSKWVTGKLYWHSWEWNYGLPSATFRIMISIHIVSQKTAHLHKSAQAPLWLCFLCSVLNEWSASFMWDSVYTLTWVRWNTGKHGIYVVGSPSYFIDRLRAVKKC